MMTKQPAVSHHHLHDRATKARSRSKGHVGTGLASDKFAAGVGRHAAGHHPWIVPPFYRTFWYMHNVALVSTPISFGMYATRLYEG